MARVDSLHKFGGDVGQGDDRMPPPAPRHAVDEVDDPVLEPANAEAVDHVDNQRSGLGHLNSMARLNAQDLAGALKIAEEVVAREPANARAWRTEARYRAPRCQVDDTACARSHDHAGAGRHAKAWNASASGQADDAGRAGSHDDANTRWSAKTRNAAARARSQYHACDAAPAVACGPS